ncbi:MAG: endolytic transglycosylase MltG [Erysipelotrichaceae bacterium]|nr:endolytic transglycosylase MltG [Erysipelotrichaceae bacterium]MDD3923752.1 endolytic transglycosylase MltG [Erysipelotrichaceae bacterium]MDD4642326.1 endolytic transglycosylase MltG [Erysipelotrichaceae bacterium]
MKKKKKRNILGYVILVIVLIGTSVTLFIGSQLMPIQLTAGEYILVIENGDNARSITEYLKENEVIKNDVIAYFYVRLTNLTDVKVGTYIIDKSWDVKRIFTLLNDPKGSINTDIKVTIPEGLWAKQIAYKIEENTKVGADELLELWNDESFIESIMEEYPFLTDDVLDDRLKVKLEGYLFPETYYFYENATALNITKKLLDQTNEIYQKYKTEFDSSQYSIHELFTLASITQFESGNEADNKIISGVWFNRLEKGMLLQSSVTVCYALYDYEHWRECEVNPNLDSLYNTYRYSGIPIGPINNPGESAIESVLNPEKTDYLYFIADVYGDQTIYYAKTYAEHLANIDKYLK